MEVCPKHDVLHAEGSLCWCCDLDKIKADAERIKGPDDTLQEFRDPGTQKPLTQKSGISWPSWVADFLTGKKG